MMIRRNSGVSAGSLTMESKSFGQSVHLSAPLFLVRPFLIYPSINHLPSKHASTHLSSIHLSIYSLMDQSIFQLYPSLYSTHPLMYVFFIHSFIHSIHPSIHPFIHPIIHSFIHSFIHSIILSFIHNSPSVPHIHPFYQSLFSFCFYMYIL